MDKRKGIILAIVLFLIIGLGTFVFAGGSDEGSGDGTITPQPDGGDDNDPTNPSDPTTEDDGNITEGEDEEDTTRPTGGNDNTDGDELVTDGEGENNPTTPTVDYKALLDELANMVESATSKEDLAEAEQFRKDNNITEENVATLNDEAASKTYDEVIAILTDNDLPVVTPDDLNGSFTNKDSVAVEITDTTDVSYTLTINGEEVTDADLANLTEEGNYELTVTDSAFNSTTITFTVDRTNPVLLVNDEEVENGETIYVNEAAKMTVAETNLETVLSNKIDITKAFESMGSWTAQKDGAYNIVVTDKAGNETSYTIIRDTVKIEVNHLYVLNNNHNDYEVSDDVRYKVIGNGQDLYVEYVLKEEFSSTPVITVGGQEFEMNCGTASWDDSLYKCDANITITEDMKLENGEVIPFTITGVKDIAGNETIVTEENVTVTEKYGQVIYDNEKPIYSSLGLVNITHYIEDSKGDNLFVANVGDTLRVMISFDELLEVNPTVTLGGVTKEMHFDDAWADYSYWANIKITEDMNLTDGNIDFVISGYADAAGNVGVDLTSSNIKNSSYTGVKLDTTAPIVTFSSNGGSSYNTEFNVEVTIEEENLEEVYYVFTNAQTEEKVIREKFNKGDATEVTELTDNKFVATLKNANGNLYLWVKAVDKLGNVSYTRTTNKFKIDTIAPVVNVEYSTTELTNGNIVVTLSANEPVMPVDAGTWNPNGAYASSLSKSYPSNADQTIKVVDRAGNEVEVNIKITNIDKTIPYLEGLVNGTQALSVSLKAVDDNFDYIQLTNTETGRVINESREWTGFGGSEYVGKWTAQVFDKAGNGSEIYLFEILPERTTSLVDGVSYESLSDAVEAAKASGSTVELVDDITVSTSDYIEIKNGEVNIDLNGNNIMFESSRFSISDNGTLNLTGEGTISSNVAGGGPIYLSGSTDSSATAYANLNVGKDVTVEGNNGILIFTIDGKRGNAYGVNVNIDGTVRAIDVDNAPANIGVYVTGNLRNATTNAPIITLSETARVESGGVGIYAAGYATWNINGAYIEGAESAVGIKSGILNMNSGTLKANGTLNIPTEPFGNGMNSSGAALQIESNASYVGEMEINISGGRLISENAVAIYEYGQKDIDTKVQKINITGGEFISTNYKENFLFSTSFNDTFNNGFITGGTFNRNENDALLQYIADGYTVVEQGGNYIVVAE